MAPDRHLGPATIDLCYPDLLITESTYATTIRDSKYCREREFLKKLTQCIKNGGKVLIPVFALGRAQELCLLLENYWDRMNLNVPIYFSGGITEKVFCTINYYLWKLIIVIFIALSILLGFTILCITRPVMIGWAGPRPPRRIY